MSGSYKVGEVSGLLSSKKTKKKKSELDSLFSSASPYCAVTAVFKSSLPASDIKEEKGTPKSEKKRKRKSEVHESENVNPVKKKIKTEGATSSDISDNLSPTKKKRGKKGRGKREAETDLEIHKGESPRKKKKPGNKMVGKETKAEAKAEVRTSSSAGFCPPPGIVHESLMKDKKTRLEEREEGLAETKSSTKKKKKKENKDEDEDDVTPKRVKIKRKKDPAVDARTIFVGNLPVEHDTKAVKKVFKKYGKIESIRLRSAIPANPSLPKKVAVIKHEFHPDRKSINAYVVFSEEEEAKKALRRNGKIIGSHHIVVDRVGHEKEHDHKTSVFVGNLPFNTEDDELWEFFDDIGNIKNVRVIRDKKTGIGKGFAYVNFKDTASVDLALKLNGDKFKERSIRVSRSQAQNRLQQEVTLSSNQKPNKAKKKKFSKASNATSGSFQGQKALTDEELKRLRKKKRMARTGLTKKGGKANAMNALLRLKKGNKKAGATGDSGSSKDSKNGLGEKRKKKKKVTVAVSHGKLKKGLGSGKKSKKLGMGNTGKKKSKERK